MAASSFQKALSTEALLKAWKHLYSKTSKRSKDTVGIDGISINDFEIHHKANIAKLARELHNNEFRFKPLYPHFIPKPHSEKFRLICVPTVEDRIVPTVLIMYGKGLPIVSACGLVYIAFYLALNNRVVSAVFASRLFVFLGFISYPLYLIHENAMVAMTIKTHHHAPYLPDLLTPWPGIAVIVLASYLIAKYLEPFLREGLKNAVGSLSKFLGKQTEKRGIKPPLPR